MARTPLIRLYESGLGPGGSMQRPAGEGGQKSPEQLTTSRAGGPSARETTVLKTIVGRLRAMESPPRWVFLFGSRAREDYGPSSDVDVLAVWDGPAPDDSWLPDFPDGDLFAHDVDFDDPEEDFGAGILDRWPTVELFPAWWVPHAPGASPAKKKSSG